MSGAGRAAGGAAIVARVETRRVRARPLCLKRQERTISEPSWRARAHLFALQYGE